MSCLRFVHHNDVFMSDLIHFHLLHDSLSQIFLHRNQIIVLRNLSFSNLLLSTIRKSTKCKDENARNRNLVDSISQKSKVYSSP